MQPGCAAAAKHDALKYRGHNGHYHPGYTFIPTSVETCGYLGKPLVRYLNTLSEVAAARGPAVTKGSFLAGAHRELSVALIKCQRSVYRGYFNLLARAAGCQVSPGAEVPYEDSRRVFVRRLVARVGRSRLVVGPCVACYLRSGVALALEILFFVPLSIVTKPGCAPYMFAEAQQHSCNVSALRLRSRLGVQQPCRKKALWSLGSASDLALTVSGPSCILQIGLTHVEGERGCLQAGGSLETQSRV